MYTCNEEDYVNWYQVVEMEKSNFGILEWIDLFLLFNLQGILFVL